jgi:hypothetical protein
MKAIKLEIDESPQAGTIDENGDFKFYLYTSNQCDDEFEEALETLMRLWDLETDVALKINIKFKDVYKDLYEMHNARGKIQSEDTPLFEALRKDCQWIIDQINELEMNT